MTLRRRFRHTSSPKPVENSSVPRVFTASVACTFVPTGDNAATTRFPSQTIMTIISSTREGKCHHTFRFPVMLKAVTSLHLPTHNKPLLQKRPVRSDLRVLLQKRKMTTVPFATWLSSECQFFMSPFSHLPKGRRKGTSVRHRFSLSLRLSTLLLKTGYFSRH